MFRSLILFLATGGSGFTPSRDKLGRVEMGARDESGCPSGATPLVSILDQRAAGCTRPHVMLRRMTVLFAACALGLPGTACTQQARQEPRHVILISVDTLRADRLNVYGYEARRVSPAMDGLAKDGILFENHVAAAPWTTPSHLSLLTGLDPSAHGVTRPFAAVAGALRSGDGFQRLSDEHVTLAEVFSKRGYATAAFTGGLTMDGRLGFDRGFGLYDTSMTKVNQKKFAGMTGWIKSHRDVPFFLFWHTFEVHAPYLHGDFLPDVLPNASARKVRRALARLGAARSSESADIEVRGTTEEEKLLIKHRVMSREVCEALYDGGVLSMDTWIGRLVDELQELGLYDRTLIVVTSDHGEQLGETAGSGGSPLRDGHFYNRHGRTLTEEMVRIPLIVKLPGGRQGGARVNAVSRTIDVMPTILAELSLPIPEPVQGGSLRSLWERPGQEEREAYSESLAIENEAKSIRMGRYKYIVSIDPTHVETRGRTSIPARPSLTELYDLESDPGETENLLARRRLPTVSLVAGLDDLLRRHASQPAGQAQPTRLDTETLEGIKALGYVGH